MLLLLLLLPVLVPVLLVLSTRGSSYLREACWNLATYARISIGATTTTTTANALMLHPLARWLPRDLLNYRHVARSHLPQSARPGF